jgi:PAS domain S-box-containing protein
MKLLVTGGTGFIGSQLAREARAHGHEVVVTGLLNNTDEQQRADRLQADGITVRDGSLRVPSFVQQLVRGCDAVIHLAAAQHAVNVSDDYFLAVNVEATRLLLEACVRAQVTRFVYGSTIGVYGCAEGAAITEETELSPDNIYGRSKAEAERVVRSFSDRLETTIVRISETYGPEDLRLLKLFKAARRGVSILIGDGRNLHQPIHVQDLARGLILAAERPAAKNQTILLAGPSPLTTREMIETVRAALGAPRRQVRIPLLPVAVAARVVESLCKRVSVQPPLHTRRLDFFRKSFWFQTTKARRVLGFEPTISFPAGIRDTLNWYANSGYLKEPLEQQALAQQQSLPAQGAADVPLAAFDASDWRMSDILEYTHDAIIVWEMGGAGILYWNRAAEQLYGFSRQQAVGRTTHLLLHTQLEGGVDELEGKLSRYGIWLGLLRHRRADGGTVLVDARLSLMARRDGRWLVLEVNREPSASAEAQNLAPALDKHLAHMKTARPAASTE